MNNQTGANLGCQVWHALGCLLTKGRESLFQGTKSVHQDWTLQLDTSTGQDEACHACVAMFWAQAECLDSDTADLHRPQYFYLHCMMDVDALGTCLILS